MTSGKKCDQTSHNFGFGWQDSKQNMQNDAKEASEQYESTAFSIQHENDRVIPPPPPLLHRHHRRRANDGCDPHLHRHRCVSGRDQLGKKNKRSTKQNE